MNKRYSLHKIDSAEEFTFSPAEYSYFKYGDKFFCRKICERTF
ncbi:phosphoribosyltransferase family protein [Chryseobacterium sp. BIGb0186]